MLGGAGGSVYISLIFKNTRDTKKPSNCLNPCFCFNELILNINLYIFSVTHCMAKIKSFNLWLLILLLNKLQAALFKNCATTSLYRLFRKKLTKQLLKNLQVCIAKWEVSKTRPSQTQIVADMSTLNH